jgi:spore coat polysaccharide biosynthesis predicted glycosyltransferase SpsG
MLRATFQNVARRPIGEDATHVLIAAGGDDERHVTAALIGALDEVESRLSVQAMVGPFTRDVDRIEDAGRRSRHDVHLVRATREARALMADADVAIASAGQTVYELLACGTPTVAFEAAGNQAASLDALGRAGVVSIAGRAAEPGCSARAVSLLERLRRSIAERRRLSEAARALVDGRGADRVAAAMLEAA